MKKTIVLSLIILLLGSFNIKNSTDISISIIVHKDNPVATLTAGEVKLYWLRKIKKRWPEINKNIRPTDRKSTCAEQESFYKKVLNMSASDVENYFTQKQYENAEKPQDKFINDASIIDFVSEEMGAIGYVNTASLNAELKNKVKVVFVL
jgi:ABC-type phosphate transport system substrate-binding protein